MMEKLIIFDTTLRDGEQSPGATMTGDEKVRIAQQLERLGVDVIEAGFAAASVGDFLAIQKISSIVKNSTVCSLSRALERDIEKAGTAISAAARGRIHTFIATSPIHMQMKLHMTPEQVIENAVKAVRLAREYTDDVEFSAEDASRSEPDFLARICEAAIEAGATTVNLPDTVGYAIPEQFGSFVRDIRTRVPNSDKAVWSVHCHDDLGMATANSLAGVHIGGARQLECTINGLGERAGNCPLEEAVMAISTRSDYFQLQCGINTKELVPTSKLVSTVTGFPVQPNKAIVGANAFAHASGIHQDGVIKARQTYEIMRAEDVGWARDRMVLGKLSGRNAFKQRIQELGIPVTSENEINEAFLRFKDLADRKSEIYDEDIQALFAPSGSQPLSNYYGFVSLDQRSETGERPYAKVVMTEGGGEVTTEAYGNGPVDSVFKAIEAHVKSGATLDLYAVNAITGTSEALGDVVVRLSLGGRIVNGVATDADIIAASAKAYIAALNKLKTVSPMNAQLAEQTP
ncbi:2-isopropylmalate synthase [Mesosutterella sp. AGMB02718]|uniref:2-isopropylmalate synthase n=1 Tax=Mesosutterella faecium TaxID=2925194 RepID=A0ABT7IMW5_9BURK|nr:2-isopropylmalate synthase [Mesosutterella sp. AGMB02718]MDL2059295.1 2-isopropylmalate synthase [Mesosutterella sp. AGMB02718]